MVRQGPWGYITLGPARSAPNANSWLCHVGASRATFVFRRFSLDDIASRAHAAALPLSNPWPPDQGRPSAAQGSTHWEAMAGKSIKATHCVFLWYSSRGSDPVAMTLSGSSGRAKPGQEPAWKLHCRRCPACNHTKQTPNQVPNPLTRPGKGRCENTKPQQRIRKKATHSARPVPNQANDTNYASQRAS